MTAVIRLILAKERLAKLFSHRNAFVGQAGNEREFDQDPNTGFASALVSLSNNITLKKKKKSEKDNDHCALSTFGNWNM